jgi:cyclic-di-GMP phosphodiesterase, flagellum assembly factor TipF
MRLGTVFVVIWMAVIAASIGAMANLAFGFGASESAIIGLAALTVLSVYHYFSARTGIRSVVTHQFADLARGDADLARQVGELARRVAAVENRIDHAADRTRALTDPIAIEIGALGARVRQLSETVSAQEATLTEIAEQAALGEQRPAAPADPFAGQSAAEFATAPDEADAPRNAAGRGAAAAATARGADAGALASIRSAVEAGRIDVYLQPIVTLPQRKVRYYEATSRLRSERGELWPAGDFIAQAEAGGLMPTIDNLVAVRCVQVVRRLLLKNRDVGLFCNLSHLTLSDPIFPQMLEFLDANRAIAPSLVLEFTQAAVRQMGPVEHESLAKLAERGFRFSLDNVADLDIEPRDLASRNFRFIKIPASLLLNRNVAETDIHPADLSDQVGRFGIDLIADKIESEGSVVDLLDCDVRYGQGFLFSPPRPVRAEVLQGIADRSGPITHEIDDPAADVRAADRPVASPPAPETGKTAPRTTGVAQLARGTVSRG